MAEEFVDQLHDSGAMIFVRHQVGRIFQHRHGIGHRHAAFAKLEQGMIVFRVPHAHDIVRREPEFVYAAVNPVALFTPAGSTMTEPLLKMT